MVWIGNNGETGRRFQKIAGVALFGRGVGGPDDSAGLEANVDVRAAVGADGVFVGRDAAYEIRVGFEFAIGGKVGVGLVEEEMAEGGVDEGEGVAPADGDDDVAEDEA